MREINPESLEAAARELASEHFGVEPDDVESYMKDNAEFDSVSRFAKRYQKLARAAITAFLAAERERGYDMVPREPTAEMAKVCAGIAKVINPSLRGDAWKAVALDSLAIWRGMWDAAAPIKPSEKEG